MSAKAKGIVSILYSTGIPNRARSYFQNSGISSGIKLIVVGRTRRRCLNNVVLINIKVKEKCLILWSATGPDVPSSLKETDSFLQKSPGYSLEETSPLFITPQFLSLYNQLNLLHKLNLPHKMLISPSDMSSSN